MSKSIKKFLKFLVAGFLGLLMFCVISPVVAEASELYFDEDGNLYFHTRDKKASGSTRYMTIGWVIKRYDMPMDAPGQQYVVVTKTTYKPDEVDSTNSKYVLCYFKTDKDEILDAVRSESEDWYNQLYQYGSAVYIDSVMTVVKGENVLGTLYKGGSYTGEVYFDYEGIAGARDWASLSSIKAHFDMEVVFPALWRPTQSDIRVNKMEDITVDNYNMLSFVMGVGQVGKETYNVAQGVPSGEELYLKGIAEQELFKVYLQHIEGVFYMSVTVPIEYTIVWKDYEGVTQTEKRTVYSYYQVSRPFSYYEYVDIEQYSLQDVIVTGSLWSGTTIDVPAEKNSFSVDIKECQNIQPDFRSVQTVDGGILTGTEKGIKPSIPSRDYGYLAEQAVGNVYVRNDSVIINDIVILDGERSTTKGRAPVTPSVVSLSHIYKEGIQIPTATGNGIYDDTVVQLTYVNKDCQTKEYECTSVSSVVVHTPVYCSGCTDEQWIIGEPIKVALREWGTHRDILGYGNRSYSQYVGYRAISCPFPVEYEGCRYETDQLIFINSSRPELTVCSDAMIGQYHITIYVWAYNAGDEVIEMIEQTANLSVENYGAWNVIPVTLITKGQQLDKLYQISGTH